MALQTSTVKTIINQAASQFHQIELGVNAINGDSPDYFPYFTQDDDYYFEFTMNQSVSAVDNWKLKSLILASPLNPLIGYLNMYFATNIERTNVGFPGALDNYLYDNSLTCYKQFADAQYFVSGYKMSGVVVENSDVCIFGEFGCDTQGIGYFDSLVSYQTDDISAPYGTYDAYTSFAPTDQVEVEFVHGTINFDIHLICKDKYGEAFVFTQQVSGTAGEKVKLNLTEKISGVSGLETMYSGVANDLVKIQTIAPEV